MKRSFCIFVFLGFVLQSSPAQNSAASIDLANQYLKLSFNRRHKTFTVSEQQSREEQREDWAPLIQNVSMSVRLKGADSLLSLSDSSGEISSHRERVRDAIGVGTRLLLTVPSPKALWQIELTLYDGERKFTLASSLMNTSPETWRLRDVRLMDPAGGGKMLFASDNVLMQVNGYQSWSECDVERMNAKSSRTSYWSAVWNEPSLNRTTLFGFIENRKAVNSIHVERFSTLDGSIAVGVNCELRTVELSPEHEWQSDKLLVAFGPSPQDLLADYAGLMQSYADSIEKPFTPTGATTLRRNIALPTGWCSWYCYYQNISEDTILANLDAAAVNLRAAGAEYIQIDDGYQVAAGDWETNRKFPDGHRWLVDRIHRKGFKAGLWVAPFAVAESSAIFKEHRDWLLKGEGDTLMQFSANNWWGGRIYSLDPTVREVQTWLTALFEKIVNTWGYDYVKIDFLYYAAEGGAYHRPVSPVEAYRLGLAAIRKGVGADKLILGCGAPLGPSVGYVDAMRIGGDVYAGWGGIVPAVNAAAQRSFYHGRVWFDDPDCLVVREPITIDQARVWASVIALSGQMSMSGDKLPILSPDCTDIIRLTIPSYEKSARQIDLFTPPLEGGLLFVASGGQQFQLPAQWSFMPGDASEWKEPSYDDSGWKILPVPSRWEDHGYPNLDGFAWYRVKFTLPRGWPNGVVKFHFAKVDDCDETFLNGQLIGKSGDMPPAYESDWDDFRSYTVPDGVLKRDAENVLAVRVYDGGGPGGISSTQQLTLPSLWLLPVPASYENWNIAGIFNWSHGADSYDLSARALGLSTQKTYYLYEIWSDRYLGEMKGSMRLNLAPTSCDIISIHEKRDIPIVLSTSRHITQGAVDIADEQWNGDAKILSITSQNLLPEPYKVTFSVPQLLVFRRIVSTEDHTEKEISKGIWQVTFSKPSGKTMRWGIELE